MTYYHLSVKVDPTDSTISGENKIQYQVLDNHQLMQIDLQPPLKIVNIYQENKFLDFERNGNVYLIKLSKKQHIGDVNVIVILFEGKPTVSKHPPWSGGFI